MSLTHNAEADFAASEIARLFVADPSLCFDPATMPSSLSASASYEASSSPWPKADGVVSVLPAGKTDSFDVAIEYKRTQEGPHGLLTALGQAQGYLHKGYSGAAIVVPSTYSSHDQPAQYVKSVLDRIAATPEVGVFHYNEPDLTNATPFSGRLSCVRPVQLSGAKTKISGATSRPKTQWVHMREGSTTRDGFYRFLQIAMRLDSAGPDPAYDIPEELIHAIGRLGVGATPERYLSSTTDDKLLSRIWRAFWFGRIATRDVLTPWVRSKGLYVPPRAYTDVLREDNSGRSKIFEGRATSLKERICDQLNSKTIDEKSAWESFAAGMARAESQRTQGVAERAHSYREDMDSSLAQLGWIDAAGRPTEAGYRFVSVCERYGGANSQAAIDFFGATLLRAGHYATFLHYVHRLSEERFASDPLAFTEVAGGIPIFSEDSYWEYLSYLEERMSDDLRVIRKVSGRARPRVRTTFQVELTLLRNYGFVSSKRYRLGVGIPIDWEKVLSALNANV